MRYSPLKQINRTNVSRLKRIGTYPTGEVTPQMQKTEENPIPAFECSPLVVQGVLYFITPANRVIALEPENGKEILKCLLPRQSLH